MAHPLLVEAAKHTAQARAINDEFEGKAMPAEAARQMEAHLSKATDYRQRVTREAALVESEQWIAEPQYKHDMTHGAQIADKFGHGKPMGVEQRKELANEAFFRYIRKGEQGLTMEQKAALVEDSTGQNLIPPDFAGVILKSLPRDAVIRNLATVRPTTKKTVEIGSVTISQAGWGVLETGGTLVDGLAATPAAQDVITVYDLNAQVLLGRDELEDSDENLADIIQQALSMQFAEAEDTAFGSGSGTGQPWAISHNVTQSVAAAAHETVTGDELKKVPFTVPSQFRKNGVFLAATSAEQAIALLKDSYGRYLLQPNSAVGEPATLFGYPFYTCDGLPQMSSTIPSGVVDGVAGTTDSTVGVNPSIVFGDVRNGYLICERRGLTVQRLNERYAELGKVGLLFTHRVGGDVIRPRALATYLL